MQFHGASEPLHGCSHTGTVSNWRQQQQQQRRGWNVWGVNSDNVRVVRIAGDSWSSAFNANISYVCIKWQIQKNSDQQNPIVARSLIWWTVAMLCCMNQRSISVQSSTVWQPIKMPPFSVCASVRDKSEHCENGERLFHGREWIRSRHRATCLIDLLIWIVLLLCDSIFCCKYLHVIAHSMSLYLTDWLSWLVSRYPRSGP